MRLTPSRAMYGVSLAVLAYLMFRIFLGEQSLKPCDIPHYQQESLLNLISKIHSVLLSLRLTHALCYESLLGQVRHGQNLPWEETGSLCLLEKELERHDQKDLGAAFQGSALSLTWDSSDGRYLVTRMKGDPNSSRVKLVVLSQKRELQEVMEASLHRVGWKRKPLPSSCQYSSSLDCVPARLMEPPLPLANFGVAGQIPVPREGAEMLKYQFPNTWWKDIKPDHC